MVQGRNRENETRGKAEWWRVWRESNSGRERVFRKRRGFSVREGGAQIEEEGFWRGKEATQIEIQGIWREKWVREVKEKERLL